MIKRLVHIVFVLMLSTGLSLAKNIDKPAGGVFVPHNFFNNSAVTVLDVIDTTKVKKPNPEPDDKKKIKEIAKAKRQAKPEKLSTIPTDSTKVVPQRQRRPDGLVRPPEIPRRNNN
jgi:hypothetical protein